MKSLLLGLAVAAGLSLGAGAAAAADGPTGLWRLSDGRITVRVAQCGGAYCGTLAALAKPLDGRGKPKIDWRNPNPALRNRPVIGITVLRNMEDSGPNRWAGTIYNADDGHTYSAYMSRNGNAMTLKACVTVLCKTMKFVKVD